MQNIQRKTGFYEEKQAFAYKNQHTNANNLTFKALAEKKLD